ELSQIARQRDPADRAISQAWFEGPPERGGQDALDMMVNRGLLKKPTEDIRGKPIDLLMRDASRPPSSPSRSSSNCCCQYGRSDPTASCAESAGLISCESVNAPSTVSRGRPFADRRSTCKMLCAPWLNRLSLKASSNTRTPDDRLLRTDSR